MTGPGQYGGGGSPPPGWYPDPGGSGGQRWWDGSQWAAQAAPGPNAPPSAGGTDGFAITSLILAVVGVPVLSIIFGHLARGRIKRSGGLKTGNGLALAGLIIGYLWLAVLTLIIVLAATGVLDEENADDFTGREREIAVVLDDLEQQAKDEEYERICSEILTPEFANIIAQGSGKSCADSFRDELNGFTRIAEIDAETITVTGSEARADVDEEGDKLTFHFVQRDGVWRVSLITDR